MNGYIIEENRPKINLIVANRTKMKEVDFLIDTGFDGEILLPESIIEEMELESVDVQLVELADGTKKIFPISIIQIEWYEKKKEVNVIIGNEKAEPLIGTELMQDSKLLISFPYRLVNLEKQI